VEDTYDPIKEIFKILDSIEANQKQIEESIEILNIRLCVLEGSMNPAHRPPKNVENERIIELVKSGKSARHVAKMLRLTPNTVTSRLKEAGYRYRLNGDWMSPEEIENLPKISEEEKKELTEKIRRF
jgi:DNA invertase Pin-like site-specific DNA recombinase